jgi:hypothetical protein
MLPTRHLIQYMIILQPLFPGENAVDQLVHIIKVLGTPTREEVRCMNPNYNDFRFPQIKAHPWHKVCISISFLTAEFLDDQNLGCFVNILAYSNTSELCRSSTKRCLQKLLILLLAFCSTLQVFVAPR